MPRGRPLSIMRVEGTEQPYERKLRMLTPLANTCLACSMCELGLNVAIRNNIGRDPHVFSSMTPTRFMVVGQGPGWNELEAREPFVGEAGANFNAAIQKCGLSRQDFYICNAIRCFVPGNAPPSDLQLQRCRPFLVMEINLIRPYFIIALGAAAFRTLCPGVDFGASLGKFTKCAEFGVQVFAVYHPSPLNLSDAGRRVAFETHMALICEVVKAKKAQEARC